MKESLRAGLLILALAGTLAPVAGAAADDSAEAVVRQMLPYLKFKRGIALDLGCGDAGMALAVAKQTELRVHCLDSDEKRVAKARQAIDAAGLYGTRVSAAVESFSPLALPANCATLIFCGDGFAEGKGTRDFREIYRVLSPNGVAFLGQSAAVAKSGRALTPRQLEAWLAEAEVKPEQLLETNGVWAAVTKPFDPGWDEWTCRAHDPANTLASRDSEPFAPAYRPQWFDDFLPALASSAVAIYKGRAIFASLSYPTKPGTTPHIQALDAFNGVELWSRVGEKEFPVTRPMGMYSDRENCSDMAVAGESIYLLGGKFCHVLDLDTGKDRTKFPIPAEAEPGNDDVWLYVACAGDLLLASVGTPPRRPLGWGMQYRGMCKAIFALDRAGGTLKWIVKRPIFTASLVIDGGRLFYCARAGAGGNPDGPIGLYALDLASGKEAWASADMGLPAGSEVAFCAAYREKVWAQYVRPRVDKNGEPLKDTRGDPVRGEALINAGFNKRELDVFSAKDGSRLFTTVMKDIDSVAFTNGYAVGGDHHGTYLINIVEADTGKPVRTGLKLTSGCSSHVVSPNCFLTRGRCVELKGLIDAAAERPRSAAICVGYKPTCAYPGVPAYGMLFVQAPGCACSFPVRGNLALAPGKTATEYKAERLVKGPGYGKEVVESAAQPPPWAGWRADIARSGHTAEAAPAALKLNWTRKLSGAITPLAAGYGLVVCGSSDSKVYALEATSGQPRWQYIAEGPVRVAPFLWKGKLYFSDDGGWVHCLRADNGELLWRFRAALTAEMMPGYGSLLSRFPAGSGVLVHEGTAYFAAGLLPADGTAIYALDAVSGEVRKQGVFLAPKSPPIARGAMAIGGGNVYFSTGVGVPWKIKLDDETLAPSSTGGYHVKGRELMAVADDLLAVSPGMVFLYHGGYSDPGGWDFPSFPVGLRELPVVTEDVVYGLNQACRGPDKTQTGNYLSALKRDALRIRKNGLATFVLEKGQRAANPETWRIWKAWKDEPMTVLIAAGGTLLSGGTGKVYATEMKEGKELWSLPVPGVVKDLAFQNGRLLVLTDSGTVACFGPQE